MASISLQKRQFLGPNFSQVVEGVFDSCGREDIALFVGLARHIWLRRNDVIHGGKFVHPGKIILQTRKATTEFQQAQVVGEVEQHHSSVQGPSGWSAPSPGWVKANWDAALDPKGGRMGYGAVVQDHTRHVIAACSMVQTGFLSPESAKARAALMALHLCKDMGFTQIQLEGDALRVIEAVRDTAESRSRIGNLVADIQAALQEFTHWQIDYVRRTNNSAAHSLAQLAVHNGTVYTWRDEVPECIRNVVLLERISSGCLNIE